MYGLNTDLENPALGPILRHFVNPVEFKAVLDGVDIVCIAVSDMDPARRFRKLFTHAVELVFVSNEIHFDFMALPQALLVAHRAIGGASNKISQRLRAMNPGEWNLARRVPNFEGAIYVETKKNHSYTPKSSFYAH